MSRNLIVRIIDPKSPFYQQEFICEMVYYGGNGRSTTYHCTTPKKENVAFAEEQIDLAYFREQELTYKMNRLDAHVGDMVKIIKEGSYVTFAPWTVHGIHKINSIEPSGHVEFDDHKCSMFRPVVKVIIPHSATSEIAVYKYVEKHPDCGSKDIADALYSKISLYGRKHRKFKRDPTLIKREWASKLLQNLKKKGLVYYPHINIPRWRVTKER